MRTILLLYDESESPKRRLQNVAGSKVTQRLSDGTPGCNCDRWDTHFRTRVPGAKWQHSGSNHSPADRPVDDLSDRLQ